MRTTASRLIPRTLAVLVTAVALLAAACGSEDTDRVVDQDGEEFELDVEATRESIPTIALDVDARLAVVEDGTLDEGAHLDVETFESAYVGEVGDDLFIGVAIDEVSAGEPRQVTVYLCDDDELGEWLTGEIDANGVGTLTKEDSMLEGDGTLRVELEVDDQVRGTVTLGDSLIGEFTATAAGDDGGLFRATATLQGDQLVSGWILFPDGRLVGTHCIYPRNPHTGESLGCVCRHKK